MRFPAPGYLVRIINPRLFNPRALVAVLLASALHKVFLSRKPERRIRSTAKQEASLALLCARLPSALQSAGCGSKATLWGVTLSSSSAEDPQAAALLRQFLQVRGTPHPSLQPSPQHTITSLRKTFSLASHQARRYHVEKTAQMIEATLRWRREYGVEKLRAEDFADLPADEIAPKADADGHSVVTLRMGAVPKSAFANRARYLRWRLCMQERGLQPRPGQAGRRAAGLRVRARLLGPEGLPCEQGRPTLRHRPHQGDDAVLSRLCAATSAPAHPQPRPDPSARPTAR